MWEIEPFLKLRTLFNRKPPLPSGLSVKSDRIRIRERSAEATDMTRRPRRGVAGARGVNPAKPDRGA
jgi:hypothetical protein